MLPSTRSCLGVGALVLRVSSIVSSKRIGFVPLGNSFTNGTASPVFLPMRIASDFVSGSVLPVKSLGSSTSSICVFHVCLYVSGISGRSLATSFLFLWVSASSNSILSDGLSLFHTSSIPPLASGFPLTRAMVCSAVSPGIILKSDDPTLGATSCTTGATTFGVLTFTFGSTRGAILMPLGLNPSSKINSTSLPSF